MKWAITTVLGSTCILNLCTSRYEEVIFKRGESSKINCKVMIENQAKKAHDWKFRVWLKFKLCTCVFRFELQEVRWNFKFKSFVWIHVMICQWNSSSWFIVCCNKSVYCFNDKPWLVMTFHVHLLWMWDMMSRWDEQSAVGECRSSDFLKTGF